MLSEGNLQTSLRGSSLQGIFEIEIADCTTPAPYVPSLEHSNRNSTHKPSSSSVRYRFVALGYPLNWIPNCPGIAVAIVCAPTLVQGDPAVEHGVGALFNEILASSFERSLIHPVFPPVSVVEATFPSLTNSSSPPPLPPRRPTTCTQRHTHALRCLALINRIHRILYRG